MNVRNLVIGCTCLLAVFVVAVLPVVTAQTTPAGLVLVSVRVLDSKNLPLSTLTQENFQVLEENKEQKIVQFSPATEPLTLGVVYGLSARGPVTAAGQRDRISVDIATAIDKVREANPTGTVIQNPFDSDGMFTAVSKGMEDLGKKPGAKKAMVIITDGLNAQGSQPSSIPQPNSLIEAAKVSPFPIFFLFPVLNLPAPAFTEGSNYATGYYLEQIADYSGGEMITGQIENDLGKASVALRDSLKNLYVLGYQSANAAKDGKWRKLTVKVTPPAGVKVKVEAKKRYFVPKG